MAYQSNRGQHNNVSHNNNADYNKVDALDAASQRKEARQEASKKTLKTAAKGAGAYFGGPLGAKAVDKIANTKVGDKILNQGAKTLNKMPGMGRATEKLNNSSAIDAADKGIDLASGGKNSIPSAGKTDIGGGQNGSLPSSNSGVSKPSTANNSDDANIAGLPPLGRKRRKPSFLDDEEGKDEKSSTKGFGNFFGSGFVVKAIVFTFAPLLLLILLLFIVVGGVAGLFSEYEDAFGISHFNEEETGGLYFEAASKEQEEFYNRINAVKLSYQASGRTVDPLKIIAVYHVLNNAGANLEYKNMTTWAIMNIADAMFDGNTYSEDTFRKNLISYIIPQALPNTLDGEREQLADDIFDYIERYYSLIGKDSGSSCASIGNCVYDIKGFYISGRGNIAKSMQISDLKVRLMECGSPYGNGTYGKPIDQDLVSFEDYIAGVAYAEVGSYANYEVLKAQMVAARSYALARPTAMGNALGKKLEEENGQWILQITSCVADQVFCNIDEGCSYMGGGDGQGGIVRSGKVAGAKSTRDPIPEDHQLRKAAAETQGEVLINSQGYIVSSGFVSSDQNLFSSLANKGLNYKQILLQVYNQGKRNYGASDIQKASCNSGGGATCGTSSGDFANWKQYEGPWIGIKLGSSGKTIKQIGCLVTSVSMQIAKSGVETNISDFNPGTFVEYLNQNGGFDGGGNFIWSVATKAAPTFKYQDKVELTGLSKNEKLAKIKEIVSQKGVYAVAEVKGNSGQHWVAIDSISGNTINMMDPGSSSTDMWSEYNWGNTSQIAYYKVG